MDFLYWLQSVRTPFFDRVFSLITTFGEETLFIAIAMAFFWCIDKKRGYYLLLVGFTGVIGTQILKMSFRIPRPWVLDPEFPIVESAREAATGYSFPSGHTQCATTLYGGIAGTAKKNAMRIGGIALVLLVAFSRLYLGVHTLLDVGVGLLLGTVLLLILYPLYKYAYGHPKRMYAVIGGIVAITLANLIFVHAFPFPQDVDAENLENAISTAWKMTGIILGVCLMYPLDHKVIQFETKAVWWAQILKLAGGMGLLVLVRLTLKTPLNALLGASVGNCVRYFLMALVGGVLWPLTFRYFARLGKKKETKKA